MSLHINKNRDNSSELEHDDPDKLVPEWFDFIENDGAYVVAQQARSFKAEIASNLVWQSFK